MSERTLPSGSGGNGGGSVRLPGLELLRQLDEGAQGVVYEALQLNPERRVAVKMLKAGVLASPLQLERFRNEAEALAKLEHDNVVQVHYGDVHERVPYLVMELVDGPSLLDHCRDRGLNVDQRLELFVQVCDGVAHAHEVGIFHRDLKPDNIRVSADGKAKVLDFGVARRVDRPSLTETGMMVGTLAYMAPEQLKGEPASARSEVHALGLILYELLTGRPAYSPSSFSDANRVIAEVSPEIPSRAGGPRDRDADAIVMKALAKSPQERYATADALRDDVNRLRSGYPVSARRAGTAHVAWKWLRRHPKGAALFAAIVVALGAQDLQIRRERDRARAEANRARQTTDMFVEMFKLPLLEAGHAGKGSLDGLLESTYQRVTRTHQDDDPALTEVREAVALLYLGIGEAARSTPLLTRVYRDRKQRGESPEVLARVLHDLATSELLYGRLGRARDYAREALDLRRAGEGPSSAAVAETLTLQAEIADTLGRPNAARNLRRQAAEILESAPGRRPQLLADLLSREGAELSREGRHAEAAERIDRAVALMRSIKDPATMPLVRALRNQGEALVHAGRPAAAIPLLREALGRHQNMIGGESELHGELRVSLASACTAADRHEEAVLLLRDAVRAIEYYQTDLHPDSIRLLHLLADAELRVGREDEAERLRARAGRVEQVLEGTGLLAREEVSVGRSTAELLP